ncbi:MAG: lamin tail domain-containing protein, partial [Bacteroidales bacterium]
AAVSYHIVVSDRDGRTNVKPCEPAVIRPLSGNTPLLFINEFMADNKETVADELGNYSDWIEIYNGDNKTVFLGDLYLTDNFDNPDKWQLPAINLNPGGFALFWADGNITAGDHHTSFKLSKEGEEIGIYDKDFLMVDTVSFGLQQEDVSRGRKNDGAIEIVFFNVPTPGRSNNATSVEDALDQNPLIVYPNPSYGNKVRLNQTIDCIIYNSRGAVVFKGTEVNEIDLSDYLPGLYLILADDGRMVKFIVAGSK